MSNEQVTGSISDVLKDLNPLRWLRKGTVRVPVLRLSGAIGIEHPIKKGLDYATMVPYIDKAFDVSDAAALAIIINSPGGTPAQAHLISSYIRSLSVEKSIPVFAFVEDVAASGGYMLACAADEIYATPTSVLGSIGVISSGFGFSKLIEKIGVERRIYTSGKNKSILDPFSPEKKEDIAYIKNLQSQIHQFFISFVKERRGDKLNDVKGDLFTGAFWVGEDVLERGLADGNGLIHDILREKYGEKLKLIPIETEKKGILSYFLGFSQKPFTGASSHEVLSTLEEKSLWNRFGL